MYVVKGSDSMNTDIKTDAELLQEAIQLSGQVAP
jgi:Arc/MetJ family transcription regulator